MSASEAATRHLLSHRKALFAYIFSIVRDHHLAEDVFQDVSVTVIRRWEEFGEVRDFWALAREIARRQSLAALRKTSAQPSALSPEALDAVDRGFDEVKGRTEERREALEHCIEALPGKWRRIVRFRYWTDLPVSEIASRLKRSVNTVSVTLNRIRSRLADCVSNRLGLRTTR